MDIQQFIQDYGYFAIFLGSLIEGESIMFMGGVFASQGYLNIWWMTLVAFIGTTIADQVLYMVGRHYGVRIFDRFPKLRIPSQKAFDLLHRFDALFIISCRFIYGIRVASAIVIGAGGVLPRRFIPLNILSAAIWSVVSCFGFYFIGDWVIDVYHALRQSEFFSWKVILTLILLILVCAWYIFRKIFSPKTQLNEKNVDENLDNRVP